MPFICSMRSATARAFPGRVSTTMFATSMGILQLSAGAFRDREGGLEARLRPPARGVKGAYTDLPVSEGPSGVARIEAFSDGVFAIAITLLVFGLKAPAPEVAASEGLWRALARLWPSFVAYALSFAIIGIMWANHHNIFRYIERANHAFVMWNLGLLFCVGFLPFPTA